MEENSDIIIRGIKPTNKIYGYLSNDSKYGFIEDTNDEILYWPTITHYIEAKKFEGTSYEKDILRAKTPLQAKRMAKEREITIKTYISQDVPNLDDYSAGVTREKIYGIRLGNNAQRFYSKTNDSGEIISSGVKNIQNRRGNAHSAVKIKQGWDESMETYLREAIRRKFSQNKGLQNALLSTLPNKIIGDCDKINILTANILIKLREDLEKSSNRQKLDPQISSPKIIPKTLFFNDECSNNIRTILIQLSKYISGMEGWDRIFPEMVDDAIFNIYPHKSLNKSYQKIGQKLTSLTHDEKSELETYNSDTRKLFTKIDKFQLEVDGPTKRIVDFVVLTKYSKNIRTYVCEEGLKRFMTVFKGGIVDFDKLNPQISIPPSRRWYRNKTPKRGPKDPVKK